VDLLDPQPGLYGPDEIRGISPTAIDTWAVFAEDSLALTGRVRLSAALRHERLALERVNLNANGSVAAGGFERTYESWSWRAGAVVSVTNDIVAYGQYANAKDPVSSNVFLVNANQNFDLTEARQWELGLKSQRADGRAQWTVAYFDIERDDVLERFAVDSATNIGGISSRGLEVAGTFRFGPHALGANAGFTDSTYRPSANFVKLAGNRPPNVPTLTANLWASRENIAGLPLEIGGSARHVSDRYADNANAIRMKGYVLGDLYAAWTHNRVRITARVDNVTDTAYASWSDVFYLGQTNPSFLYANQLMLGAPRAFSVIVQKAF
jgi:iron complex outermembrane receptor protein